MEILSIGEKIKRARIYKGLTLKDLCEDKISVSKMSCIENNKANFEEEMLEHISLKLDMDIEYLKEDVDTQIRKKLEKLLDSEKNAGYEKELYYLLDVTEDYGYFHYSFQIMHNIFNYYLDTQEKYKIEEVISRYYQYCLRTADKYDFVVYNIDMGRYLYDNYEFLQAATYYNSARKELKNMPLHDHELAFTTYKEVECYVKISDFQRAYELSFKLDELMLNLNDELLTCRIYHIFTLIYMKLGKDKYEYYNEKFLASEKISASEKATMYLEKAEILFQIGEKQKAQVCVNQSIELYPESDKNNQVKFHIKLIKILLENEEIDLAKKICEDTINSAISLNLSDSIEKCYFFKALIAEKTETFFLAEMYINLSLDVLKRNGTNKEIYQRYMDIGNMYHKNGHVAEALKYFSLAVSLQKKI